LQRFFLKVIISPVAAIINGKATGNGNSGIEGVGVISGLAELGNAV
jgi:hypothetical protein